MQGCENFTVFITGANNGGLTANLGGIPVFIPVSQLERKIDKTWWTAEVRKSIYCIYILYILISNFIYDGECHEN